MISEEKYNAYMEIIQKSIEHLDIAKKGRENALKFMRQLERPEIFTWQINYWDDIIKFEEKTINEFTKEIKTI